LHSQGFHVLRFWEHDLEVSLKECVRLVSNRLRDKSA
jgi:very-short-patch-repair endonuclease